MSGTGVMHVDLKMFNSNSYKLGWLLLLPAFNYAKGMWARLRGEGRARRAEGGGELDPCGLALNSIWVLAF